MERCLARVKAIKQGNPLDTDTMLGAQASKEHDGCQKNESTFVKPRFNIKQCEHVLTLVAATSVSQFSISRQTKEAPLRAPLFSLATDFYVLATQ
jgi:hypothetical protein